MIGLDLLLGWEEAEHAVGAIGGIVEIGLNIYRALTGRGEENAKDEGPKEGDVVIDHEALGQVLNDHEERLTRLEKPSRRPRRKKAPPKARTPR